MFTVKRVRWKPSSISNTFYLIGGYMWGVSFERGYFTGAYTKKAQSPNIYDTLNYHFIKCFKNTYREKVPSNKTPTPSKSMNIDISVYGRLWVLLREFSWKANYSQLLP